MAMAADDDNTDVEAIIMKNLCYTSPVPEKDCELSFRHPSRKRTPKRSRRKSHANEGPPSDRSTFTENVMQDTKHTEERALQLALIHTQKRQNRETVHPNSISNDPVVFQAPDIKERAPYRRPRFHDKRNDEDAATHPDAAEIVEKYRREVGRFGSSALHKRDRKLYETAELVKLGCRKPKNEKMPIGILVKKRKYQKIRERKKKEMDLATGMLVRTTRK